MKKTQAFLLLLATLLLGYSAALRADDTDIYVDNAGTAGVPNILFVLDNGANFSANAKIGCSFYSGTTEVPSLGDSTGAGIEQCALVDAINSLPDGAVNMGILVSNASNFATNVRTASDTAFHEQCTSTGTGGCLLRKLTLMNAANKASMVKFIKSWRLAGSSTATQFNIKVNTALPGTMMQEAWAYFRGKVGMSGMNYANSVIAAGCQKNFIIYIANGEKSPAGESPSPYDGANALTSAQVGATTAQKLKISETVKFVPNTCGVSSIAPGTSSSDWSENWADEWARLMFEQDAGSSTAEGQQNIITYTIGVVNDATCTADYPALLSTMAKYGGGKYFKTGNASEMTAALQAVLNEVQAVNSVFSSASLPVSVNSEGSYLNQIYLGMFRPDASAAPRWAGNLKQYQLVRNAAGNLILGDATGEAAISSAGTGFISPNAISFWTYKDGTRAPDDAATGGFFKNDKKGVPESAFDSPDGEVVEKGGVAQQLRRESLTADFGATAGGSSNPRRMYTYCPTGLNCDTVKSLTDSRNAFSTANTDIAREAFGSTTTVPITSIVRTGTSALVTTNGAHGFTTGTPVTISNVAQADYNVTQAVTVNSPSTFTITGLPDSPTSPSAGTYSITKASTSPVSIVSITRASSTTGGRNTEVATATTATPHTFTTASSVLINGAVPSGFNYLGFPSTIPSATEFTFPVRIDPPSNPANTYQATISPGAYPAKTVTLTRANNNTIGGLTATPHGFWVGQSITIAGSVQTVYNGTYTVDAITNGGLGFTVTRNALGTPLASTGNVAPDATPKTVALTRVATTSPALATVSGAPALFFGNADLMTRVINITKSAGTAANETAYVQSNATITCRNALCTTFTYPITVTPSVSAGGTMSVGFAGTGTFTISPGNITRTSGGATATATVTGLTAGAFSDNEPVTISPSGTALSTESAYAGTWTIRCTGTCTSFTFGPVELSPSSPATGANMQAYSSSSPPDRDTIIRWTRGEDNYGDEKGPGAPIKVRPSIHGDVLHSRPLVINYGDSRGIVVFYGSNDGVYRAVNGNQPCGSTPLPACAAGTGPTGAIGTVPPGGELWGLILPEHYGEMNRLRLNSPELKFPSSTLPTAQPKNYFIDGPTGAYQKLKADGTIDKAYIYLSMRRGGRFLYALDVTDPAAPAVVWTINTAKAGFEELGQTWSRPRLGLLQSSAVSGTPTLVFGGGYDPAEDEEDPLKRSADTMGRGIFVVNALTGDLIWSATPTCTTSATCLRVAGLTHAVPSDIAFVDRDANGFTDRFYFGDLGGNVWRADVSADATTNWTVTKLAALGCATGPCASGTTPRKFFFPPSVLSIRPSGQTGSYDAVSIVSGDREHPLKNTATGSAYNVEDRFFMLKDTGTNLASPMASTLTMASLFNATAEVYPDTLNGFYITFARGEKAVNAPLAVSGSIFFATNKPIDRAQSCVANLGESRAYSVNPFDGGRVTNVLPGGGLAPGAVTGYVNIKNKNPDGTETTTVEKFCIGCGVSSEPGIKCNSALNNCPPPTTIPKSLRRTYWYKK